MRDGASVYYSKLRVECSVQCLSLLTGEGSGRFCKVLSVQRPGLASVSSLGQPRPPWEWRLSPASASPSPSLAKTPEDGNNGGQGGLGWGKGESQDNPADTLGHSSMVTDI